MAGSDHSPNGTKAVTLSVDVMGGDAGPAAVVAGCAQSAKINPELSFVLHGPEKTLHALVARRKSLRNLSLIHI